MTDSSLELARDQKYQDRHAFIKALTSGQKKALENFFQWKKVCSQDIINFTPLGGDEFEIICFHREIGSTTKEKRKLSEIESKYKKKIAGELSEYEA